MEVRRAWEPADVVELVKRVKQFGNPYILMRASNLPLQEMWTDVSNSLVEAKVHRVPESCKRKWKLIRQLFFKLLLSTVPVPLRYQDWFGMVMDMWLAAGKPKFGERTYFKRAVIKQSDLAHIKNGPDVFTDAANHNFKSSSGEEASENEESSEESFGGEKDPGAALEADLNHSATVHHWKVKEAIPTATMHKHMEVRRAWEPEEVVELVKRVKLFGNPYILMRASNLPLQEMWIDVSDSLAQARIHRVPESCKGKWKVTRQLFFKLLLSTAPVPPRYQDWFGMVMEMWEAAGRPKFGERTYFSTLNKGYTRRSRGSSSNPGVSSQKILKIEARNEDLPETENHERILDYSIQTACCSLKERSGIRSSDLVKVRNGPGTFTPVTRSYSGSDDEAVENESIEEQKAEGEESHEGENAGEEPPHLEPESTEKSRSCTPSGKKKSSRLIKEEEPTSSPTNLQPPKKARIQLHHEFSSLYHVPQQPPILPLLGDNGSALSTTDLMRRQVIQLQRLNRHQEELTQLMKDIATHMKTIVTEVGTVASSMAEMKQELKCELVHLRQAFEKTNSTQDSSPQDSPASSKSAAGPSTLQLTPVQSSGFSSSICTLSVAPCTPPALNPQFQVTKK